MGTRHQAEQPSNDGHIDFHFVLRVIGSSFRKPFRSAFGTVDQIVLQRLDRAVVSRPTTVDELPSAELVPHAATISNRRSGPRRSPIQAPIQELVTGPDFLADLPVTTEQFESMVELKTAIEMVSRNAGGARRIDVVGVVWCVPIAAAIQQYARARNVSVWCSGENERGLASITVTRAVSDSRRKGWSRFFR